MLHVLFFFLLAGSYVTRKIRAFLTRSSVSVTAASGRSLRKEKSVCSENENEKHIDSKQEMEHEEMYNTESMISNDLNHKTK